MFKLRIFNNEITIRINILNVCILKKTRLTNKILISMFKQIFVKKTTIDKNVFIFT